jgi:hypothetical protein
MSAVYRFRNTASASVSFAHGGIAEAALQFDQKLAATDFNR